jgi:hypothetical protein
LFGMSRACEVRTELFSAPYRVFSLLSINLYRALHRRVRKPPKTVRNGCLLSQIRVKLPNAKLEGFQPLRDQVSGKPIRAAACGEQFGPELTAVFYKIDRIHPFPASA